MTWTDTEHIVSDPEVCHAARDAARDAWEEVGR